jgi:hypothetical protein
VRRSIIIKRFLPMSRFAFDLRRFLERPHVAGGRRVDPLAGQ